MNGPRIQEQRHIGGNAYQQQGIPTPFGNLPGMPPTDSEVLQQLFACRSMHTTYDKVSLKDVEAVAKQLKSIELSFPVSKLALHKYEQVIQTLIPMLAKWPDSHIAKEMYDALAPNLQQQIRNQAFYLELIQSPS